LLSEAEFAKPITTESKVFSIYAVGVVKGYKRSVRVRVQTVVDFRNAPPLGAGPVPTSGPTATAAPQGTTPTTTNPNDALKAANQPQPGGTLLYFRVD